MIARLAESITLGAIVAFLFALAIGVPVVVRRLLFVRRMRAELSRRRVAALSIHAVADERDLLRVWHARARFGPGVSAIKLYAAVVERTRNEEGATPSIERLKAIDLLCRSEIWVPAHRRPKAS